MSILFDDNILHEEKEMHHFSLLGLVCQHKHDQCRELSLVEHELVH